MAEGRASNTAAMLTTWRGCQGLIANIVLGPNTFSNAVTEKIFPVMDEIINTPGAETPALKIRETLAQTIIVLLATCIHLADFAHLSVETSRLRRIW